jgi:hypothetical protein
MFLIEKVSKQVGIQWEISYKWNATKGLKLICTIWGSHSSGYEESYLLGQLTFNRLHRIIPQMIELLQN